MERMSVSEFKIKSILVTTTQNAIKKYRLRTDDNRRK